MRFLPVILLFLSAPVLAAPDAPIPEGFDEHRSVQSSHFILFHEAPYAPVGILNTLEGLHAKLLLDLRPFAPWAGTEKIRVYVYADGDSYVRKTGIPAWSAAFANVEARSIHCHETEDLQRTLAHELTHLFFTPYFLEQGSMPPSWLNEGLAKAMEWDYGQAARTGAMNGGVFSRSAMPLSQLTSFDYHHNPSSSPEALGMWYEQSASVTAFLLRRYPQAQFVSFCDEMRHGKGVDEALGSAYGARVPDAAALERQWRESFSPE
jgi:hypothetical protein